MPKEMAPICSINTGKFPKGRESHIFEAAMGFRIIGAFFDRYWTFHIIENVAGSESDDFGDLEFSNLDHWQQRNFGGLELSKHNHWQQSKVLELVFFGRILAAISQSAQKIIDAIEEKSGFGKNAAFGKPSSEDRDIKDLQ